MSGHLYSFETSPDSEFAAPTTGRHAAFKVLGASEKIVVISVLDGIWQYTPTLSEASKCSVLREHRFAHKGGAAIFGVNADWWKPSDLTGLRNLGRARLTSQEKEYADRVLSFAVGTRHSTLHAADYGAEGEWRWAHDRDAFIAESNLAKAKAEEDRQASERRYRERLSKLSWEQLLAETPFSRWKRSPPYPPKAFTEEARRVIHGTCESLMSLGPKPRKAWVRKILKETVHWFNEADRAHGGVIETEEREDICSTLEELAFVAGQRGLVEEIDEWREW